MYQQLKNIAKILLQLSIFWSINELGNYLVRFLKLPIPGNVLGLMILFLLLITGLIKLNWIEAGGNFLLKHLSFFFIPFAVGFMSFGHLILEHGIALFFIIAFSAVAGIIATGYASQYFIQRTGERCDKS